MAKSADFGPLFASSKPKCSIQTWTNGLGFPDFEDAVTHEAAVGAGAAAIVTRNTAAFRAAILPAFTPDELLATVLTLG